MSAHDQGAAKVRDRILFPFRWLRDTVNDWRLCRGNHDWTYDAGPEDGGVPYCEVCGMPGSWVDD